MSEFWRNVLIFLGGGLLALAVFLYLRVLDLRLDWSDRLGQPPTIATRVSRFVFLKLQSLPLLTTAAAVSGVIILLVASFVPIDRPPPADSDIAALTRLLAERLPNPKGGGGTLGKPATTIGDSGSLNGPPSTSGLEHLLEERLPTGPDTDRRHREIVDALNRLAAAEPTSLPILSLGSGISAAALLVIGWLTRKSESPFWKGASQLSLILGIIGTFVSIIAGVWGLVDRVWPKPSPISSQIIDFSDHVVPPPAPRLQCHDGSDNWLISPFSDTLITHFDNDAGDLRLQGQIENILGGLYPDRQRISALVLIGAVDQKRLRPEAMAIYRANSEIAMQRARAAADVMERQILDKWQTFSPAIVMLPRGARYFGNQVPIADQATDRSVQLCVVWN